MQMQLNRAALEMLPGVINAISEANSFESNQIYSYAVRRISDNKICLDDMTKEQLKSFENDVLEDCKLKWWIK